MISCVKRFSTEIIYLMDPSKLNSITASSFQWRKGFNFSLKVNKPDDGYNDQMWYFSIVGVTPNSHNVNVIKVLMLIYIYIYRSIEVMCYPANSKVTPGKQYLSHCHLLPSFFFYLCLSSTQRHENMK